MYLFVYLLFVSLLFISKSSFMFIHFNCLFVYFSISLLICFFFNSFVFLIVYLSIYLFSCMYVPVNMLDYINDAIVYIPKLSRDYRGSVDYIDTILAIQEQFLQDNAHNFTS